MKLAGKVGVGVAGAVASMYAGPLAGVTTRLAGDQIKSNIENTLSKNSKKARDARRAKTPKKPEIQVQHNYNVNPI